jgi:NAD(P)-dependent dehydrogenase (short-subunit alcohol dehydrogenase family)
VREAATARRIALVTGGTRGIGRSIALDLARDHAVVVTYRGTPPDGDLSTVHAIRADFRIPGSHDATIDAVIARFGRLHVIVNNAGALETSPLGAFDLEAMRINTDVNLLAPHGLLMAALPHLAPGAAIVSISSVNAVLPPMGAALYGASKAALDLWTRAMAKELGPRGIRVNAVAPGAVNTDAAPRDPELTRKFVEMTALGRLATADDIAAAVRFLASDAAAAITGEVLTVSGGYRL